MGDLRVRIAEDAHGSVSQERDRSTYDTRMVCSRCVQKLLNETTISTKSTHSSCFLSHFRHLILIITCLTFFQGIRCIYVYKLFIDVISYAGLFGCLVIHEWFPGPLVSQRSL